MALVLLTSIENVEQLKQLRPDERSFSLMYNNQLNHQLIVAFVVHCLETLKKPSIGLVVRAVMHGFMENVLT